MVIGKVASAFDAFDSSVLIEQMSLSKTNYFTQRSEEFPLSIGVPNSSNIFRFRFSLSCSPLQTYLFLPLESV